MRRWPLVAALIGLALLGAILAVVLDLRAGATDGTARPAAPGRDGAVADGAELAFELQRVIERLDALEDARAKREARVNEKLDDLATQLYAHDVDTARNLMQLQTNVLRRLGRLEAGAPAALPEDPAALRQALAEKGVTLNLSGGFIELKGRFVRPGRTMELAAVTEGGPLHETLLRVDATPSAVREALVKLGMKPGSGADHTGKPPTGDPVYIYAQWEGQTRAWRLEDLIIDLRDDVEMSEPNWVFTGSDWASDMNSGQEYFIADGARVLIGLAHKFSQQVVIASAHEDAAREDIWVPNPRILPEDVESVEVKLTIAPKRLPALEWR